MEYYLCVVVEIVAPVLIPVGVFLQRGEVFVFKYEAIKRRLARIK